MRALFPLFTRALREHTRSEILIWIRIALVVTLVVCLIFFSNSGVGAQGMELMIMVTYVNAIFITVGACAYFATSITTEKEEGTLPLLQMTGVKPFSLLLGKSTALVLEAILLLSVQIPFIMIAVTLGGVTWIQVLAAYTALAAYLFMTCNLGLLASVLSSNSTKAAILTCTTLWFLLNGAGVLSAIGLNGSFIRVWEHLSVFGRLQEIPTIGFDSVILSPQVNGSLCVGLCAFIASAFLLTRFSQDDASAQQIAAFNRDHQIERPKESKVLSYNGLMYWKDYYFLHGGDKVRNWKLIGYGLLILWLGIDFFKNPSMGSAIGWAGYTLRAAIVAMIIELAVSSARMFSEEIKEETLPSLCAIPHMSFESLVEEKERAVKRTLYPVLYITIASILILAFASINRIWFGTIVVLLYETLILIVLIPYVWVEYLVLKRLALYFSLKMKAGAAAFALGAWVLGNIIIITLLTLITGPLVFLTVFVPLIFWAIRLRDANLRLLQRLATE
jgi:hypothetical protein